MNRKVMRMLYQEPGMVRDIRSARDYGRSQQIGFGEQDRMPRQNRMARSRMYDAYDAYDRMGDDYDDQMGGISQPPFEHSRSRMTMGNTQAGQMMDMGTASIEEYLDSPLTTEEAMKWAECLEGGPHWKPEEVKQYALKNGLPTKGPQFAELYAWTNALYCDYKAVLKKHGVDSLDAYVDLANATMQDEDAVENKSAIYYRFIVDCE